MNKPSCMGGWCAARDKCALHLADDRSKPAERLCEPGATDNFEPVRIVRSAGSWERANASLLAPAQWFEPVY